MSEHDDIVEALFRVRNPDKPPAVSRSVNVIGFLFSLGRRINTWLLLMVHISNRACVTTASSAVCFLIQIRSA